MRLARARVPERDVPGPAESLFSAAFPSRAPKKAGPTPLPPPVAKPGLPELDDSPASALLRAARPSSPPALPPIAAVVPVTVTAKPDYPWPVPEDVGLLKRAANTVETAFKGSVGGGLEYIGHRFGDVGVAVAEDLGLDVEPVTESFGNIQAFGRKLKERTAAARAGKPEVGGFGGDVLRGVASLGTGPLAALSEAQGVYEEELRRGNTVENARKAGVITATVNMALDTVGAVGIGKAALAPAKPGLGRLYNAAMGFLRGARSEGITEGLQSVVTTAATETYDAKTDFFDEEAFSKLVAVGQQALYESAVGGVVGGGLGGLGGGLRKPASPGVEPTSATTEAGPTPTPESVPEAAETPPRGSPGSDTGLGPIEGGERFVVQRTEEPGVAAQGASGKPQGLYVEPVGGDLGRDLGGETRRYEIRPKNILDVTEELMLRPDSGGRIFGRNTGGLTIPASAGVKAARVLLGEQEFARLRNLSGMELRAELGARYPSLDWSRYHDNYERIEALAGVEARRRGFDLLRDSDEMSVLDDAIMVPLAKETQAGGGVGGPPLLPPPPLPGTGQSGLVPTPDGPEPSAEIRQAKLRKERPRATDPYAPEVSFKAPDEDLTAHFRRRVQDRFHRQRVLQEAAAEQGGVVSADEDAYTKAQLYHARTADRLDRVERFTVDPILKEMADSEITPDQMGDFLYAEHAPTRNERLRTQFGREEDGLSGMTDSEARAIITKSVMEDRYERMREIANKFRRNVVAERLRISVAEGLLSPKAAKVLMETFSDGTYVPLFMPEGALGTTGRGGVSRARGFSVSGPEAKALKGGSAVRRDNPFVRSIIELEKTIHRAEQNKVGRALYEFFSQNPNEKIVRITEDPITTDAKKAKAVEMPGDEALPESVTIGGETIDPREAFIDAGLEFHDADPSIKYGDNVLAAKVDGRRVQMEIRDPALAQAMKNLDPPRVWGAIRAYANFFRAINTIYTPSFIAFNFIGDFQTALANATGETDVKAAKAIAKGVGLALKGIYQASRARQKGRIATLPSGRDVAKTSESRALAGAEERPLPKAADWRDWAEDFNRQGGRTGFFVMDLDLDTKIERLRKAVRRHNAQTKAARHFENALERLRDLTLTINESVEGASRVAFYRHMVEEKGMSREQAALAAKNLTVNFDRKGEIGTALNSLYVFANASIQGTTQMIRSLSRSPALRKAAAGATVAGAALAAWNAEFGGDDYDDLVRTSPWIFENHFVFMLPNGGLVRWRLPYGYSVFPNIGQISHAVASKQITFGEGIKRTLLAFDAAFNPLSSNSAASFITPTILDPFVEVWTNKDWLGNPVRPEHNPYAPRGKESLRHFKSVSPPSKAISRVLSEYSGGSGLESGAIEISPELIDHFTRAYTGGVGREVAGLLSAGKSVVQGEVPEAGDIPIWRRIYSPPSDRNSLGVIYDVRRASSTTKLRPGDLGAFYDNMNEMSRKRSVKRDMALDMLTEVTRNQGKILAAERTGKTEGRRFDFRANVETQKLRQTEEYQRAHYRARRLPREGLP